MSKLLWNMIGKPLAALGGRSFEEMRERTAAECDKSVLVGLLCLLSIGVIFAGHWLFWSNFGHTADIALPIAASIALLIAVMYRVALRSMETMGFAARTPILACLGALMAINAALAGHELVLLAFRPQVEAQGKLDAAHGVTTYGTAVETSLGLPQLRGSSIQLDHAAASTKAERDRVPDVVVQLQRQARACEAAAAQLHGRVPAYPDHPTYATAESAWREQRAHCRALDRRASQALAQHRAQFDRELSELIAARLKVRRSLEQAADRLEETLKRDTPTLTASATTGFARHAALWAAVAAGTVPLWAAGGLMSMVLVIDAFSFVVKLLARDDLATAARIQTSDTALLYGRLHAEMLRRQRAMVRQVVRSIRSQMLDDVEHAAREMVAPAVMQAMEERAFVDATAAVERAHRAARTPSPSMMTRVAGMARAMRRSARRTSATAPAAA